MNEYQSMLAEAAAAMRASNVRRGVAKREIGYERYSCIMFLSDGNVRPNKRVVQWYRNGNRIAKAQAQADLSVAYRL